MSSRPVELRPPTLADVETVTGYYFGAWQSNLAHLFAPGALDAIPDDVRAERRATFAKWFGETDGHRSFVAVDEDDLPLGHVTVIGDELLHLFIDPASQGGGVGKALLTAGERMIAEAGHRRARLMTLVGNDAAVAFYERHGWSVTGHRVDETYFGEPQAEQELAKDLG
jgi:GNAT superfamily N-acetyltransferase